MAIFRLGRGNGALRAETDLSLNVAEQAYDSGLGAPCGERTKYFTHANHEFEHFESLRKTKKSAFQNL